MDRQQMISVLANVKVEVSEAPKIIAVINALRQELENEKAN